MGKLLLGFSSRVVRRFDGSFIISFGGDKSFMIAIMIILFIGIFAVYNSFVTYKLSVK